MLLWQHLLKQQTAAAGAAAYRYWRIFMLDNSGDPTYLALAEVRMRATVAGVDHAATGATASTFRNSNSAYNAAKTIDDIPTTAWYSNSLITNQWLRYDFGSAVVVGQISLMPENTVPTRGPNNFILQGSNDDSSFIDVKSFSGTTWVAGVYSNFNI